MSNTRSCFQLSAKGPSVNGWQFKIKIKAIFVEREDAEKYIPEFKERCANPTEFDYVENIEDIEVNVLELDLHD